MVLVQVPVFFLILKHLRRTSHLCVIGYFNNSMDRINSCDAVFTHYFIHSEFLGSSISLTSDQLVEPADRISHEDNQIISSSLSSQHTSSDLDPSAPKTPMKGILIVMNIHSNSTSKIIPIYFLLMDSLYVCNWTLKRVESQ